MHISLSAETLFFLFGFPVTNSFVVSLVVSLILIVAAFVYKITQKAVPSKFQSIVEQAVEFIVDLAESVGGKKAVRYVPLVATIFLFVLLSNWIGLLPGVGSLGIHKLEGGHEVFVPIFRGPSADLNVTIALALVSVFSVQYFGFSSQKISYLKKFFNFSSPVDFFAGILELLSEFTKIISFSFRLFGNVFAGEVLLVVVASLIPILASAPFFGLEIFVGFIQAMVFAILTLVFVNMAATHGEEVEHGN